MDFLHTTVEKRIATQTNIYALRLDGIVESRERKSWNGKHSVKDLEENSRALNVISEGVKRPLLCFLDGGAKGAVVEVNMYSHQMKKVKCCAIIKASTFDYTVASMLVNFFRLKIPYKVFENERKALTWLRTYL